MNFNNVVFNITEPQTFGYFSAINNINMDNCISLTSNYVTTTPLVDATTYRITDDESVWKNVGTGTDSDGTQADLGVYSGEYSWEN